MTPAPNTPSADAKKASKRRGVVLIAVLVVVVLLSLAGYQYSDLMLAEARVSEHAHRSVQAHSLAAGGVHYAAAMLSDPGNFFGPMAGNPFNNPEVFRQVTAYDNNGNKGYFSLIAPIDPNDAGGGAYAYGVMDEGGKINLNALMRLDPTGEKAHDILMKLPNMTEEIVAAILDWMDPDSDVRPGGAENEYYSGLTPPYRAKNGAIDSIDELLLVKGITRDLLYGTDANRNGAEEEGEGAEAGFYRGLSAYLTVHSREQNSDPDGKPFVFLGNTDLTQLQQALANTEVDADLAKFIIMFRQYPPPNSSGKGQSALGSLLSMVGGGGSSGSSNNSQTVQGELSAYQVVLTKSAKYPINSFFDLVNAQVTISSKDSKGKAINTVYSSPLNDPTMQRELLPKLFAAATLTDPAVQSEMTPRININTAPLEVLTTLPNLTDGDIEKIVSMRKANALVDPIYETPTWLLTEAQISSDTLKNLDPYVTTRTQVFRVQSVGYFENKGPAVRVEAVIDTNGGRPRILAWRNLTDLGKGWTDEAK